MFNPTLPNSRWYGFVVDSVFFLKLTWNWNVCYAYTSAIFFFRLMSYSGTKNNIFLFSLKVWKKKIEQLNLNARINNICYRSQAPTYIWQMSVQFYGRQYLWPPQTFHFTIRIKGKYSTLVTTKVYSIDTSDVCCCCCA